MRNHTQRAPAMFSTPGDQIVNENMVVKASHIVVNASQSTSAKKRIVSPTFFSVHVDTYVLLLVSNSK